MKPISHKHENGVHRKAFVSTRASTRSPLSCSVSLIKEKQTPQVMEFNVSVYNTGKCKGLRSFVAESSNPETKRLTESCRTQVHYTGGPRGVSTPSSEPPKKGLHSCFCFCFVFYFKKFV